MRTVQFPCFKSKYPEIASFFLRAGILRELRDGTGIEIFQNLGLYFIACKIIIVNNFQHENLTLFWQNLLENYIKLERKPVQRTGKYHI
jgi:hypothetical protein